MVGLARAVESGPILRNATVALAVNHHRTSVGPVGSDGFLDSLVPHFPSLRHVKARRAWVDFASQGLQGSRLLYQGLSASDAKPKSESG